MNKGEDTLSKMVI